VSQFDITGLLRGRQDGWLSPKDAREETGWPRSSDPTADSIEPPAAGGRAPGDTPTGDTPPSDTQGTMTAVPANTAVQT
jgi:hypothetical protein